MTLNLENQLRAIRDRLTLMQEAADEGDFGKAYQLSDEIQVILIDLRVHILVSIDVLEFD